jgi:hypothetical protein
MSFRPASIIPGSVLKVVLALVLMVGCHPEESSGWKDVRKRKVGREAVDTTSVAGRIVIDSLPLGTPREVVQAGSSLVVLDMEGDRLVHLVEARTGTHRGSWGVRGRGPGELMTAWDGARHPGDERGVWISDFQLQRLTYFDVPSFLSGTPAAPSTFSLPTGNDGRVGRVLHVTATPDGGFAATGFFTDGLIRLFDATGTVTATLGPVPSGREKGMPETVRQHAHRGVIRSHPEKSRAVIALRFFDRLELVNLEDTTATVIVGPAGFEPEYVVRQGRTGPVMARTAESRYGYLDVAVTDRRIFALYSGKSVAEMETDFDHSHFGSQIRVFDWSGQVVETIRVDELLFNIHVDADQAVLYAARHYPEPAILAYSIDHLRP